VVHSLWWVCRVPLAAFMASPARAVIGWFGWDAAEGFDRWAVEREMLMAAALVLVLLRAT